jgi:ABC-type transport system involved in cytochrome bd biosynthesis fused ATPase/permease subunit
MVVLVSNWYNDNLQLRIKTFSIKMRTVFTTLIYRKVLKMNSSQLESTSDGKIITLITKDVDKFEHSISFVTYMFHSFVQFSMVCWLVYTQVGWLVITDNIRFCIHHCHFNAKYSPKQSENLLNYY